MESADFCRLHGMITLLVEKGRCRSCSFLECAHFGHGCAILPAFAEPDHDLVGWLRAALETRPMPARLCRAGLPSPPKWER